MADRGSDDQRFRLDEHERWRRQEAERPLGEPDNQAVPESVDTTAPPPVARGRWRRGLIALAIIIPLAGVLMLGAYNGVLFASATCPDRLFFESDDPASRCGLTGNRCIMRPDPAALDRERVCTVPSDGTVHLAVRLIGGGAAIIALDGPDGDNLYYARHPGDVAPPSDPYEIVQRALGGDDGTWTVRITWQGMPENMGASRIVVWG